MKFNKKVLVAIDFDGTLTESERNLYDYTIDKKAIKYVKAMQRHGAKIILWTCREDKLLVNAISSLYKNGLICDYINEGNGKRPDSRKVNADIYIDDKACLTKINWKKYYKAVKQLIKTRKHNVYNN